MGANSENSPRAKELLDESNCQVNQFCNLINYKYLDLLNIIGTSSDLQKFILSFEGINHTLTGQMSLQMYVGASQR